MKFAKRKKGIDPKDKKPAPASKVKKYDEKTEAMNAMLVDYRVRKAGSGDMTYDGAPGPRVGGVEVKKSDGPVVGGTKKQVSKSARRVRKSAASPQAKRAAIRAYQG